ncbi:MAG: PsbP-related protein [Candidatus Spechtbacterales bacterium]
MENVPPTDPTVQTPLREQSFFIKNAKWFLAAGAGIIIFLVALSVMLTLREDGSSPASLGGESEQEEQKADQDKQVAGKTYSSAQYGFSFAYPGEWTYRAEGGGQYEIIFRDALAWQVVDEMSGTDVLDGTSVYIEVIPTGLSARGLAMRDIGGLPLEPSAIDLEEEGIGANGNIPAIIVKYEFFGDTESAYIALDELRVLKITAGYGEGGREDHFAALLASLAVSKESFGSLSQSEVEILVRYLPEVHDWRTRVENDHIRYDHTENGMFIVQVYEVVGQNGEEGHTATFEWYSVNPQTGEVAEAFL